MGYKTVGNTMAEWSDASPFVFTLSENVGPIDAPRLVTITVDLSDLRRGFTDDFLLTLKDLLIEWRKRIILVSIEEYSRNLKNLFLKIIKMRLFELKIGMIDEAFLLVLSTATEEMTKGQLVTLKSLFSSAPYSSLWGPGLHVEHFPKLKNGKGSFGQQISRILAKALTRSACVHILSRCEQAYQDGEMDIGLFAFTNLAFAVFCRAESYRQIQLSDFVFDEKSNSYFVYIYPAKTHVLAPKKIRFKINESLGILLQKQRQSVVAKYSHLVHSEDISKLALFPALGLNAEKSAWLHQHANENFGMYKGAHFFTVGYPRRVNTFISSGATITPNVLRHTIGTQLAQTGASARTIKAVLKHASDLVCRAYVDIAFRGLIETLSDALQPAFDKHLPVFTRFRSKNDPVDANKGIRSENLETGEIELTGECGKLLQCEYAPITCYGCARFIPCWDADHGTNLATLEREIEDYKRRGTPFVHLLQKAQTAKHYIILVMNAADRYRDGHAKEAQS